MYDDNPSTDSDLMALSPQTLYRGLYVRIAGKLGVDPSYVSRVARGERRSKEVEKALGQEIEQITKKLRTGGDPARKKRTSKRLRFFIAQRRTSLPKEWLHYIQADPNLKRIKVSTRQRLAPVLPVVNEALKAMDSSLKEIAGKPMKAAKRHGMERRNQGYNPSGLLEEYNLIRRCIYNTAKENLPDLDARFLVHDLGHLGEVLDFQSQSAIRAFLSQA